MTTTDKITAQVIPFSSIVGGGVMLLNERGQCIGQLALMSLARADERLSQDDYRERSNRLANFVANAINAERPALLPPCDLCNGEGERADAHGKPLRCRACKGAGRMIKVLGPIDEIAAERLRQVDGEGWTPEHDDEHRVGELALGAAAYATRASFSLSPTASLGHLAQTLWPWPSHWFKPKTPRQDLIRAGALIVAEVERLDRAAERMGGQS